LELFFLPSTEASYAVAWSVAPSRVPDEYRERVLKKLRDTLKWYVGKIGSGCIRIDVVNAGWIAERINEPERAAWNAFCNALLQAELPEPLIFATPSDESGF
jgi:hypothetical protein